MAQRSADHSQPASRPLSRALKGALCGLSLCLVAGSAMAAQADDAVVSAARMLDVRTGRMLQDVTVLVRDGRIEEVAMAAGGQRGADVPRASTCGDMTLLPGLIDMHVHLDSDPSYGGYTGLQFNDRFWSVLAVPHARAHAGGRLHHRAQRRLRRLERRRPAPGDRRRQDHGPAHRQAAYSFGATGGHCDSTYFPPSMEQKKPLQRRLDRTTAAQRARGCASTARR